MTVGQLRSLLEVAATGSVRAAAERLFVTQPAISAQIGALQKELGVRLVARDGRGLHLTPPGSVLAGYARSIVGLLEEATLAATGSQCPERGRVRLAAVTTVGEQLLPRLIAGFRGRYPQAGVSLEVANAVAGRARPADMADTGDGFGDQGHGRGVPRRERSRPAHAGPGVEWRHP